jgi:hypothetical protein
MDKKKLIDELQAYLAQELADLLPSLEDARPDNPSVERAEEIRRQLLMYKFLPVRQFTAADVICPSGLVEMELNGIRSFYLIVPSGGGLVTRISGQVVQVITPQSPLGEVLLGRRVGETVQVRVGGGTRNYKIVGYS